MPDKRSQLPRGMRHDDPPQRGVSGWKFRLGLAVKKYPLHAALLCAMLPLSVGAVFLMAAYEQIGDQSTAIAQQQAQIQINRRALAVASCRNNNAQTHALNALNSTLQAIIASSPKQQEQLRPVFERAGIDVDKLQRSSRKAVEKANADLERAKVKEQNCNQQAAQIEKLNPPKPRVSAPTHIPPGKR